MVEMDGVEEVVDAIDRDNNDDGDDEGVAIDKKLCRRRRK